MKTRSYIVLLLWLSALCAQAQEYHGTTGLLQVPSAEVDSSGTFRGGLSYLNRRFIPQQFGGKYDTFGYTVGISAWPWLQMSYSATLLKYVFQSVSPNPRYYNEDRHVNVKLIPLYEGRWWPSIALGMDDVGRFERIKGGNNGNNYYQNIYIAASKHFDIGGYEFGAHVSYRYYVSNKNSDRRGVAGGLTLRPAFYRPLRLTAEWDGLGVNVGADVLLWRHLFVQACLVHGRGFTGGLSYQYRIKY